MRTLSLFAILFIFAVAANGQNVISVNASAEVAVPADRIAFQITVNAEADSPGDAYRLHKKREEVLVRLLNKHGIKEDRITFEPISIQKVDSRRYDGEGKEGVQTRQTVILTLENFDTYEQIQLALIENNFDSFSGNFLSSETEKGEDRALQKALKIARDKADVIARQTGLLIQGIKNISHSYRQPSPQPLMEMSAMRSSDSLMEFDQSVKVTATVSVTYTFK